MFPFWRIDKTNHVPRIFSGCQEFSTEARALKGAFAVYKGEEPAVTGSVRLRLSTVDNGTPLVAHLSAMVVKHGHLVMGKRWEDINILW